MLRERRRFQDHAYGTSRAPGGGQRRYTLLFLGEFTCTSVLHLAYYAEQMRAAAVPRPLSPTKLPGEKMRWGTAEYSYEETVAHCTEKLAREEKSVIHVGMHAAQLWLHRAREIHITNFRPGAEWHPTGGSPAVRDRCVVI